MGAGSVRGSGEISQDRTREPCMVGVALAVSGGFTQTKTHRPCRAQRSFHAPGGSKPLGLCIAAISVRRCCSAVWSYMRVTLIGHVLGSGHRFRHLDTESHP